MVGSRRMSWGRCSLRRKRRFRAFSECVSDYWHIECKTVTNGLGRLNPVAWEMHTAQGIFSNLNVRLDGRFPPQRILEDSHIKIEGLKTKNTSKKSAAQLRSSGR